MSENFKSLSSSINKIRFFLAICTIGSLTISAESAFSQTIKNLHGEVELQTVGTTNGVVPFWMRSNQFGSIPLAGFSQSFIGRINKDYEQHPDSSSKKRKLIDWGFGLEARGNVGNKMNGQLIEVYGKVKLSIFQLKIGRTKDVMGLNGDTTLSSGNFAISGNALGIPKIEISIPEYVTIPIFDGLFSFKGNFAHGWAGKMKVIDTLTDGPNPTISLVSNPKVFLHQKSFYGRFGKKDWRLHVYGGFSHQVQWGNEGEIYGKHYDLSPIKTFLYVISGRAYGDDIHIPTSKIGNQIGSIDFGFQYDFDKIGVNLYRQNFYDVGALAKLANILDGLNGITLKNRCYEKTNKTVRWKTILIELLYTKNQAGELNSKYTKSGDEDYYNNYFYTSGWSYKGLGIGTPLISTKTSVKHGQVSNPKDYFINNRVIALHIGSVIMIKKWLVTTKLSYSENYGTYGTSPLGHSLGNFRFKPNYGVFKKNNQLSTFFSLEREYKNNLSFGCSIATDYGGLLEKSSGATLKFKKTF